MNGWQALGEMMTGQVGTPGAYHTGLREGYTAEKAMQDARRAQALATIDMMRVRAREGINGAALQELGYSEAAAPVLANILGANSTVNLGQLGDFQRPGYDLAARQAQSILGDTPDVEAANRATAFMEGKQYEPYALAGGGKAVFRGDTGDVELTPLGEADLAAENALADRRRRPPAERAAEAPKPKSAAATEAEVLAQARERIAGGADPRAVAQYLQAKGYPTVAARIFKGE